MTNPDSTTMKPIGPLTRLRGTGRPPCRSCGHDLRGVALDALCTECGYPVAGSFPIGETNGARAAWRLRTTIALRRLVLCRWIELGVPGLCILIMTGGNFIDSVLGLILPLTMLLSIIISAWIMAGVIRDLFRSPAYRPGDDFKVMDAPRKSASAAFILYLPSLLGFLRIVLPVMMLIMIVADVRDGGSSGIPIVLLATFVILVAILAASYAGIQEIASACHDAGLPQAERTLRKAAALSLISSIALVSILTASPFINEQNSVVGVMPLVLLFGLPLGIPISMPYLKAADILEGNRS